MTTSSSEERSTSDFMAEFRRRTEEIADWLTEESDHIGTIEDVEVAAKSGKTCEAVLTVIDGGPDERLEIRVSGTTSEDVRMTVRTSFGRKLTSEITYSDEPPRIGVSVMSRPPKTAARDIDRRLLPDACRLYNTLLSRISQRRRKEKKREAVAEQISEETQVDLTPSRSRGCYYSGRIFFERETSSRNASRTPPGKKEPKLNAEMKGRAKMTLTVENLDTEAAIAVIRAAEEKIEGPIQHEPPRKRGD